MRPAKAAAFLLIILAVSTLSILPAAASNSDAAAGEVGLVTYETELEMKAGTSGTFRIEIVNYLSYSGNDISNYKMVSVGFIIPDSEIEVYVSENDKNFVLKGQEYRSVAVSVDVDRYAAAKTYNIGIVLTVMSLNDGSTSVAGAPVIVKLTVLSPLSSGEEFNRVLGIIDNPLPEPFNSPLATAVITFLLWLIFGMLALAIILPPLLRVFAKAEKNETDKIGRVLMALSALVLILFAFDKGLRVYGASEEIIGPVEVWFSILYIVLGAVILWQLYLVLIVRVTSKMSKSGRVDQTEMDVGPLLRLLGKLVIAVTSVALIVSALGFDLGAIIMSAGIVSLGITLGAQSVLNQFFSGMVLLLTRPFKSGDLVKIGNSNTIYRVSNVNVMNTEFENWDNNEAVIMPNNAVASATISNLTGDGLIYRIMVFMNISYEDDVDLAKQLMEEVAGKHPSVIMNGTVDLPSTRVTAFLDSAVEIRLKCYVYDFNDSGKISGDLREEMFKVFKKNGITIPFPQMDVHFDKAGKEDTKKK